MINNYDMMVRKIKEKIVPLFVILFMFAQTAYAQIDSVNVVRIDFEYGENGGLDIEIPVLEDDSLLSLAADTMSVISNE